MATPNFNLLSAQEQTVALLRMLVTGLNPDGTVYTAGASTSALPAGSTAVSTSASISSAGSHCNYTMVVITTGAPVGGSVQLQGSLDGTNWFPVGTTIAPSSAGVQSMSVTGTPLVNVRAAITSAFTSGSVQVQIMTT